MSTSRSRRLKSHSKPIPFKAGHPVLPYDQLLCWLNNLGESYQPSRARRLLKLPVCIQYAEDRLGIGPAHIGTSLTDLEQGAIGLKLDDSALGESLFSRFPTLCPKDAHHCALWIEGYWGTLLPSSSSSLSLQKEAIGLSTSGPQENNWFTFAVLRVGDRIPKTLDLHSLSVFIY